MRESFEGTAMSDTRQIPHDLIENLPDVLAAVANAPLEDEEISADEERAVAEARDSLKGSEGRGTSHADAMRGLGLDRA